jgi:hypothetical protein
VPEPHCLHYFLVLARPRTSPIRATYFTARNELLLDCTAFYTSRSASQPIETQKPGSRLDSKRGNSVQFDAGQPVDIVRNLIKQAEGSRDQLYHCLHRTALLLSRCESYIVAPSCAGRSSPENIRQHWGPPVISTMGANCTAFWCMPDHKHPSKRAETNSRTCSSCAAS